jgi:hypothetical protein
MHVVFAMTLTFIECVLTVLMLRFVYRMLKKVVLFLLKGRTPPSAPVSLNK